MTDDAHLDDHTNDAPGSMSDDFRKLRAALLRVVAAFERGFEPLYRKLGAKRTAAGLLALARRNEAEADELEPHGDP